MPHDALQIIASPQFTDFYVNKRNWMRKKVFSGALFFFFVVSCAAQEFEHFDASLAAGGVFSSSGSSKIGPVTLSPTNSGLILGTFRFRFNPMHSIELNIGHTSNSQIFLIPPDSYRLKTSITEYSGAYVFSPFQFKKLEPFLFAGAGALRFYPGTTYIDNVQSTFYAYTQTSLAFLYGGGADYRLWRFLALRVQYRGLVYKEPTLRVQQFFTGVKGRLDEPTAGIVLRF